MTQEKPKVSICTMLLDRSLSMGMIHEQTVTGVNAWLHDLRLMPGEVWVNLVQFDAPDVRAEVHLCMEAIWESRRVIELDDLRMDQFRPRGNTPLIDAAFTAITDLLEATEGRDDIDLFLTIQTDGQENKSARSWADLRLKIAEAEKRGMQITFIGAGIDSYDQGGKMGLDSGKILSYGTDMASTRAAFEETGRAMRAYASGEADSVLYTSASKLRAGDPYADRERGVTGPVGPFGPGHVSPVEQARYPHLRPWDALRVPLTPHQPLREASRAIRLVPRELEGGRNG